MLSRFGALPTEQRAREMKDRDYLWCLVQAMLDREEALDRLCPECRGRAEEVCCPVCGKPASRWADGAVNTTFDPARFEKMAGGGGG